MGIGIIDIVRVWLIGDNEKNRSAVYVIEKPK